MPAIENPDGANTQVGTDSTTDGDSFLSFNTTFYLSGTTDNDTVSGLGGTDFFYISPGNDTIDGGDGYDFIILWQSYGGFLVAAEDLGDPGNTRQHVFTPTGVTVDLAAKTYSIDYLGVSVLATDPTVEISFEGTLTGIEEVQGTEGDDVLLGSRGGFENILKPGMFIERFGPGRGDDQIDGRGGHDVLSMFYRRRPEDAATGAVIDFAAETAQDGTGGVDSFSNIEEAWGSDFADIFLGDEFDQTFLGFAGADQYFGGGGFDLVRFHRTTPVGISVDLRTENGVNQFGDSVVLEGIEAISGSPQADSIRGDTLANVLDGVLGDDVILGYGGDDVINGGAGADTLTGGTGKDTFQISDLDARDTITDFVFGSDRIEVNLPVGPGRPGAIGPLAVSFDFSFATLGKTLLLDIEGTTALSLKDGVAAFGRFAQSDMHGKTEKGFASDLGGALAGVGLVLGSLVDDLIDGNGRQYGLSGGAGNDTITGGFDNDRILGGSGNDRITGSVGNDFLYGAIGNDTIFGGLGNDILIAGTGIDVMTGGPGKDVFVLSRDNNLGLFPCDLITDFGAGDKVNLALLGRPGDTNPDTWRFRTDPADSGITLVFLTGNRGTTRNEADFAFGRLPELFNLRDPENYSFNLGVGLITGDRKSTLLGGDLADVLQSLGGSVKKLLGGLGDDWVESSDRSEKLFGDEGVDSLVGNGGNDLLFGGAGSDALLGGTGRDLLDGGDGDDFLSGGSGSDRLTGGAGRDQFHFRAEDLIGGKDRITDFNLAEDELVFGFDNAGARIDYQLNGTTAEVYLDGFSTEPVLTFEFSGGLLALLLGLP